MLKFYLSHAICRVAFLRHGFLRLCGLVKPCALPAKPLNQAGFTLLELLVVVGLLGIIGLASTTYIIDTGELKRQDETEKRWDAIRKAIIGEPNLTLNGSPYVSGYVADMGRLPQNIQELFIQGNQPDWQDAITITDFQPDASGTTTIAVSGGWRGPYLYTAGSRLFRDGWSNEDFDTRDDGDITVSDDVENFGWAVAVSGTAPEHTDISVQSLGDNNATGGTGFFEDFPATNQQIINANEWINDSTIIFDILLNKDCSGTCEGLDLRVFKFEDDGVLDSPPINVPQDSVVVISSNPKAELPASAVAPVVFNLTTEDVIQVPITGTFAIGRYAAVVMCTRGTPDDLSNDVIYDGNCDEVQQRKPYFFTLGAKTSQVTIHWNLP